MEKGSKNNSLMKLKSVRNSAGRNLSWFKSLLKLKSVRNSAGRNLSWFLGKLRWPYDIVDAECSIKMFNKHRTESIQ